MGCARARWADQLGRWVAVLLVVALAASSMVVEPPAVDAQEPPAGDDQPTAGGDGSSGDVAVGTDGTVGGGRTLDFVWPDWGSDPGPAAPVPTSGLATPTQRREFPRTPGELIDIGEPTVPRPRAIVPGRRLQFDGEGRGRPDQPVGPSRLDERVRLTRPVEQRDLPVELATLPEEATTAISTIGLGFTLGIDGDPGAGRAPVVPPAGRGGRVDLGARSGWELEFDLDLFADTIDDVGRVGFQVGFNCDAVAGCERVQSLPSTVDYGSGVVVVELPANLMALVASGGRAGGPGGSGPVGGGGLSGAGGFWVAPLLPAQQGGPSGSTVYFGATGTTASAQGDYSADSLVSLAAWQVGLQTGSAELSYTVPVPDPGVGHVPDVTFSYSSGSVDGLHTSMNAQTSKAGLGWSEPTAAMITRETRGCTTSEVEHSLCLSGSSRHDGFSLAFDGVSGPLVRVTTGGTGVAHPTVTGATYWEYETQMASDVRVWRVEHTSQRGTNTDNGDHWVTWWELTTGDGTLYVFGRERAFYPPGGNNTSVPATTQTRLPATNNLNDGADRDKGQLHSAQTVPVYVSGEGCVDDLCDLAVVWNLDQVIDTSGNMAVYHYWTEENHYRPTGATANREYESAINRRYIDYGRWFQDTVLPLTVPAGDWGNYRVKFDYFVRNAANDYNATFFDTPTDLLCGPTDTCPVDEPPSFFSLHRLAKVSTQYWNGSTMTDARTFALEQQWPTPPGEETWPAGAKSNTKMTLSNIAPGDASAVWWEQAWWPNRVNHHGNGATGVPQMQMPRVTKYHNDLGGVIEFTYGQSHPPSTNSADPCYKGGPSGGYVRLPCDMYIADDPYTGSGGAVLWNKWKVTQMAEDPAWGGSQVMTTTYQYLDPPEWAFSGGTGHGPHATGQCNTSGGYGCNYWNDYRGHRRVRVIDDTGAYVDHYFYTGMENDRATATNSDWLLNVSSAPQHWQVDIQDPTGSWRDNKFELAGRPIGTATYNSFGEKLATSRVWYDTATVTDANNAGGKFTTFPISYKTTAEYAKDHIYATPGGSIEANNETITAFDDDGLPWRVQDLGDTGTADDRTTFTDYAKNNTNFVVNTPRLVATRPGAQTTAGWGDWIAATAFLYDGGAYGAAPTFGRVTTHHTQQEQDGVGDPVWSDVTFTYDTKGRVATETAKGDPGSGDDQVTSYTWDWLYGWLQALDGPLGVEDNYTYVADPAHNRPTQITDPNGRITSIAYDSQGRTTSVTPPGYSQARYKFSYDSGHWFTGWVKTETLRDGSSADEYVSSWEFVDGFGRPIQTQTRTVDNNDVIVTAQRYDNVGRLLADTDPAQRASAPGSYYTTDWNNPGVAHRRYVYPTDAGDDPQIVNEPTCLKGINTRTVFYGADNLNWESTRTTQCGLTARHWDEHNYRTTTVTDVRGNVTSIVNAESETMSYGYNLRDELATVTDDDANVTTYQFADWSTQPTQLTDPDLGTISYTYDGHFRLDTQTDARGVTLSMTYDDANRPTNVKHNGLDVSQFWYDPAGHYGQLHKSGHWNRATGGTSGGYTAREYTYNTRGEIDTTTWTIPGLTGGSQTLAYTYRDSGAVDTITYPTTPTATTVDYSYDRLERPVSVTVGGQTVGRGVTYDAAGRVTDLDRGAGANQLDTDYTFDPDTGRLDSLVTKTDTGTIVHDLAYGYTPAGYINTIVDNTPGVGQTMCAFYDAVFRMQQAWTRTDGNCGNTETDGNGPDPYRTTYFYNGIGNITGQWGLNSTQADYTYNAGPAHAPSAVGNRAYTYDQAGNRATFSQNSQTTSYEYDVQNRLVDITGATTAGFLYDTSGNRVRRVEGGTTRWYLGGSYEAASSGSELIHVTIGGQRVGSWVDGAVTASAGDHLRSASVTRSAGSGVAVERYQPFGRLRDGAWSMPTDHAFTSQILDGTGLYFYGARYYDPVVGQFTQPDSLVPNARLGHDWNRYAYVRNSPLAYIDPTGNEPCPRTGCTVATQRGYTVPRSGFVDGYRKGYADSSAGFVEPFIRLGRAFYHAPRDTASQLAKGFNSAALDCGKAPTSCAINSATATYESIQGPCNDGGSLSECLGHTTVVGSTVGGSAVFSRLFRTLGIPDHSTAPGSILDDASRAAFEAADNVGSFTVKSKHLPGAGGTYNKFDYGVDPNAAIREALTSDSALFLPNPNLPNTFRVVADLGRPIGTNGQTSIRVIVGLDGQVINAFPVKVR